MGGDVCFCQGNQRVKVADCGDERLGSLAVLD